MWLNIYWLFIACQQGTIKLKYYHQYISLHSKNNVTEIHSQPTLWLHQVNTLKMSETKKQKMYEKSDNIQSSTNHQDVDYVTEHTVALDIKHATIYKITLMKE